MITINQSGKKLCEPPKLDKFELPEYICLPNGKKQYLSKEQKKDLIYGGELPRICEPTNTYNINGVQGVCPDMTGISDVNIARRTCQTDPNCHFIGNSVLDRMGPNYCNSIHPPAGDDCRSYRGPHVVRPATGDVRASAVRVLVIHGQDRGRSAHVALAG